MDISSSNYFSVSASTNKGISGLSSGMDTENMVKQMLAGTQGKIDKQMGLKQQAEWRQEIYRDVIGSINEFQAKYLDTSYGSTLKTNFASTSFFNSMLSSVTSGDGVRIVSTGAAAPVGSTTVKVNSLASAASLTSTAAMSSGVIAGKKLDADALTAKLDKRIGFTVGADTVKVDLNGITTQEGLLSALNGKLAEKGVTAEIFEDRLRLVGPGSVAVNVDAGSTTALGLEMTGLGSYSTSKVTGADGGPRSLLQGGYVNAEAGPTFSVTLDGVEKQITVNNVSTNADGKVTAETLKDALNAELGKAFGSYVKAEVNPDGGLTLSMEFDSGSKGHELVVTGMDAKVLGFTPGATSALDTGTKLRDMGLAGDKFEFTINGEQFSFTGNDSIGAVMNTINNSGAGVRMTYSTLTDTFQMEATSTGKQYGIDIRQTQGNLLSKLFRTEQLDASGNPVKDASGNPVMVEQIAAAKAVASRELTVGTIAGGDLSGYSAESGATFKLNVDGTNHTFTLPKDAAGESRSYNAQEIVAVLNAQLAAAFGDKNADGSVIAGKENIQVQMAADGGMTLKVDNGSVVKFAKTTVDIYNQKALAEAKKTDLGLAMGFTAEGKSNVATGGEDISEIVQFKDMGFSPGSTLSQVIETLSDITFENGRLVLTGTVPPLTGDANGVQDPVRIQRLFGTDTLTFGTGDASASGVTGLKEGQDAELVINGVTTTRSSNTFSVDGITMEAVKAGGETVIGTKRDTETIVEGFKSFVDDYNALVKKLTELVDEKQSYRSYAPLTSEQKKEMSEREIELWEEKAKEGLLHRDSAIDSFLSQMRLAMYTKPAGSKLALYNIGIETTRWEDKGQLKLDETALRNALASDPNSVMTLFTDKESGLGAMLNGIIKSAANPSSASPGTLVQIAGVEGWGSEKNNNLSNNISSIASRIKELQAKYESERARYWSQFNAMESALANFNAQSSMIAQQFNSGY